MQYLVIGDLHGCYDHLMNLLYAAQEEYGAVVPYFVGDLLDRGNGIYETICWLLVNKPFSVMGNHDWKLLRWLKGQNVKVDGYPGMDLTLDTLKKAPDLKEPLSAYLENLSARGRIEAEGKTLNIVHAAAYPGDLTRDPNRNGQFSRHIYGITTGKTDPATGHPERLEFADSWKDSVEYVAHGHVVTDVLAWRGAVYNVIDLDTGAAYGGRLSGLVFPAMKFIQVDKNGEVYHVS